MCAKNLRVAPEADVAAAKLVLQPRVDALNRGPVDVADRLRGMFTAARAFGSIP